MIASGCCSRRAVGYKIYCILCTTTVTILEYVCVNALLLLRVGIVEWDCADEEEQGDDGGSINHLQRCCCCRCCDDDAEVEWRMYASKSVIMAGMLLMLLLWAFCGQFAIIPVNTIDIINNNNE